MYKEQVEIVILFKEIFLNNVIEHVINYDLDAIFEQTIFCQIFGNVSQSKHANHEITLVSFSKMQQSKCFLSIYTGQFLQDLYSLILDNEMRVLFQMF